MNAIFKDPRARLVPAHLLVAGRYDLNAAAKALRVPSLWLMRVAFTHAPAAYTLVPASKMLVWMNPGQDSRKIFDNALSRWLDGLRD